VGITKNYNRAKDPAINSTGIALRAKAAEGAAAVPADLAGADGIMQIAFDADADESGGTDVQDLFKINNLQVNLGSNGAVTLVGTIVPILGDGSDGTAVAINETHPQTMDAWQTAAGRPQQP